MKRALRCALLATSLGFGVTAQGQGVQQHVDEPRAFGHFVGDIVSRRITLSAPPPLALDETSLPQSGKRGTALELRDVQWQRNGARYELRLDYQVFTSPTAVRVFELPPLTLRLAGGARAEDVRIGAWPLAVAPLAPAEASPREGLGELRPDRSPPLIDTRATRRRLVADAAVAALLLAYLAWVYLAWPAWTRRRRPFGDAWGELRGLPRDATAEQLRAATRRLHDAFNRSAGRALFEHDLERFLAREPRFAPLRDEIGSFFARSRTAFFANGAPSGDDATWLVEFCRRCRNLERGAA